MSTTVSYKGNTIATVENNTKTLKTAGKYMEGDVVLTDVTGSSYTATITGTGSSSSVYVRLNNTKYYSSGSFTFHENDELYIYVAYNYGNVSITIDGEVIESGSEKAISYTYTLPARNIDVELTLDNYTGYSVEIDSGGASNVVYGTFTTSSTSTTQTISIPYTGNGYPIIATIEVDGGVGAWLSNTFPNRIIGRHSISKQGWSSAPNYNGTTGILNVLHTARNGEIMDQYSNQGTMFAQTVDGGINPYNNITFISKNEMKIWISAQDGTNYGLKPSTDYIYTIVYSS